MTSLADLHRAVQATLASHRLGRPVFVRYLREVPGGSVAFVPFLAHLAATVRDWLGQPLERVYALGTMEEGQVSLTLQFRDGATALVGLVPGREHREGVDLLVLGNHGALYHDTGSTELWDPSATGEPSTDSVLQAVIERSLLSHKPEWLAAEVRP